MPSEWGQRFWAGAFTRPAGDFRGPASSPIKHNRPRFAQRCGERNAQRASSFGARSQGMLRCKPIFEFMARLEAAALCS
jgi:hypothetical protein